MKGVDVPWRVDSVVGQRWEFCRLVVADDGVVPFVELCRRYGVSAKTGYKWLARYRREGPEGLHRAADSPRP